MDESCYTAYSYMHTITVADLRYSYILTITVVTQGEGAAASLPPTLDPTIMTAQGFDQDGMLRLLGRAVPATPAPGVAPAQFWAAGVSFSRAQLLLEVRGTFPAETM